MTSTSLKSEACLGAQILVCGQLADFTEGSTVQAARLSMMGAMAEDQPPVSNSHKKAQKSLHPTRLWVLLQICSIFPRN